ncbi:CHAT domain-containing protein [Sulfidibacter corallicola]|uniref:CHAT domain-containing protein n=1 Tax=Sulfidibacter corallicola TaxID=2818388 RepID=A0A8A4TWB9_SULCO|nr:CHAT domain-containing protein [Sulfidibacter corallicola]QTD54239.1 CHAT domain-containing protein [Sulfidibacter corallicola]
MKLFGERNGAERVISVSLGLWQAAIRPELNEDQEAIYTKGRRLMEEGRIDAGAALWRSLPHQAWFEFRIGDIAAKAGAWADAEHAYRTAMNEAENDLHPAAWIQYRLGRMYEDQGHLDKAENAFQKARDTLADSRNAPLLMAILVNNLGVVAWSRGELDKAEEHFLRALTVREKLAPGSILVAGSLSNLGNVASNRGDLAKGEHFFLQALNIQKELAPDSLDLALSLNNLGILAYYRGAIERAERYYKQALAIREKLAPNSHEHAASLDNLGTVSYSRRAFEQAERYHLQALKIREKLAPSSLFVANSLNNLGNVASYQGALEKAEQYHLRALDIREKLAPDSLDVAASLNNLGLLASRRSASEEAKRYFLQSLNIVEKLAPDSLDVAIRLTNLGSATINLGSLEKAEPYFLQALKIYEKLAPDSLNLVTNLNHLGNLAKKRGDLVKAEERYHRAVLVLESQIAQLGGSFEAQTDFRGQHQEYYKNLLELLLERDQREAAFHLLERFRARTLLEMMAERDFAFSGDHLPAELLAARKNAGFRYEQTQARLAGSRGDGPEVESLRRKLFDIRDEYQTINAQIRTTYPKLAPSEPIDFERVRDTLEPGTVLLSYCVFEAQTVVFVVRKKADLRVVSIPKGETFFEKGVAAVRSSLSDTARFGVTKISFSEFKAQSAPLFEQLIAPLQAELESAERLVIIPDGPLQIIPFALLFDPRKRQYLIETIPISSVISATVYAELKEKPRKPISRVVAIGDPVYLQEENPSKPYATRLEPAEAHRLKTQTRTHQAVLEHRGIDFTVRSILERNPREWHRLPQTAQEVTRIAALFGDKADALLRQDACEDHVKSLDRHTDILHIAAHGFLDAERPLESSLVLTINQAFQEGDENGILQGWEIMEELQLEADLVVLSACETGLGKDAGGEGLIGLTHAFQFAGARSIIASFWNVHDYATAHLMEHFYRYHEAGDDKAVALQKAQIDLIRNPIVRTPQYGLWKYLPDSLIGDEVDVSHPFFWAAFQLIGPWD